MHANLTDTLLDVGFIVDLIDEDAPKHKKPGPEVGTKYAKNEKSK